MRSEKKPVKNGLDYIRGSNGKPTRMSLQRTQRLADRMAKHSTPNGFWNGCVVDCGEYYRISIGGDPR